MNAREKFFLEFMEGSDKNFIIPVYQRNYNWGNEQCRQLLDDLISIDEEKLKNYFLGSIVSIYYQSESYLIIDGQQRLTTLSLLLLAIYNLLDSEDKEVQDITKEQIKNKYLINKDSKEDKKIRLKLIKGDQKSFNSLFENDEDVENSDSRIFENYSFFKKELKNINLDNIYKSIQELMIVDIKLTKGEDDPQLIFESLNSTGLALSEADKIRNFILMNEDAKKQEEYYTKYWRKIEKNCNFQTSDFIRDFLSYKTRTIPNREKIYYSFKDFYLKKKIKDKKKDFLQDLLKFSNYYNCILKPENCTNKEHSLLLKELLDLKVKVFNPALLEIFEDVEKKIITDNDFKAILKIIISYVFRRAICGISTKILNKIFVTLISDLKKQQRNSNENYVNILKYILSKKTSNGKFPTDEEVKESFLKKDIYSMKTTFYLLEKLENYDNDEKVNIPELIANKKMQVEHILPQKMTEEWKKDLGGNWEKIHTGYVHTLGNITLTAYNQKMSNFPFKLKKENGYNNSRLYLNQSLKNLDIFGEEQIKERLNIFTERAIEIWAYPKTDYRPTQVEKEELTYSLEDEKDFKNKKIISYCFLKEETKQVTSWVDFYKETILFLHKKDNGYIQKFQNLIDIGKEKNKKGKHEEIIPSYYLYTNLSTQDILKNLKKIIEETGFELTDFEFSIKDD